MIRYLHRTYLEMGFRNEVYLFEWFCMTALTITFPLEYGTSAILVIVTYPMAKVHNSFMIAVGEAFTINFSLSLIVALCISFPYFLSTLVYLCRKRQYLLEVKATNSKKDKAIVEESD